MYLDHWNMWKNEKVSSWIKESISLTVGIIKQVEYE
jgi:hypothetical protein